MNTRIEELAQTAWRHADLYSRDGDGTHGHLFRDKFAELIVQDIVSGLRDNANCLAVTGSVNEAAMFRTYASGVEQQYGVTE